MLAVDRPSTSIPGAGGCERQPVVGRDVHGDGGVLSWSTNGRDHVMGTPNDLLAPLLCHRSKTRHSMVQKQQRPAPTVWLHSLSTFRRLLSPLSLPLTSHYFIAPLHSHPLCPPSQSHRLLSELSLHACTERPAYSKVRLQVHKCVDRTHYQAFVLAEGYLHAELLSWTVPTVSGMEFSHGRAA